MVTERVLVICPAREQWSTTKYSLYLIGTLWQAEKKFLLDREPHAANGADTPPVEISKDREGN